MNRGERRARNRAASRRELRYYSSRADPPPECPDCHATVGHTERDGHYYELRNGIRHCGETRAKAWELHLTLCPIHDMEVPPVGSQA